MGVGACRGGGLQSYRAGAAVPREVFPFLAAAAGPGCALSDSPAGPELK